MRTVARRDLTAALKTRDHTTVSALRSLLAAIDNAEALSTAQMETNASGHVAGAAGGLGASEVERHHLTEADLRAILDREISQRLTAAAECEQVGRRDQAEHFRSEADVLSRYLPAEDAP